MPTKLAHVVLGALLGGCSVFPGSGPMPPLALERTDLVMDGLVHGTLAIDGACTWIVAGRDRTLLVWPADRTRWDAATAEIVFEDTDRGERRLRDGMEVALGGGAINATDGGAYAAVDWAVRPAPGCDTPTRYHIGRVVMP